MLVEIAACWHRTPVKLPLLVSSTNVLCLSCSARRTSQRLRFFLCAFHFSVRAFSCAYRANPELWMSLEKISEFFCSPRCCSCLTKCSLLRVKMQFSFKRVQCSTNGGSRPPCCTPECSFSYELFQSAAAQPDRRGTTQENGTCAGKRGLSKML